MGNRSPREVLPETTPATDDALEVALSLDVALTVLSDATRRNVLAKIGEYGRREDAEFETEDFVEGEGRRELDRLYHRHLPALDDAGLVDWDRETDTITRGPRYEEIRPLIRLIRGYRYELPDDWPRRGGK